jgi:hypothetical protein
MRFEFSLLLANFKKIAEDYCNGRVVDLQFAVEKEINVLLRNKATADALYDFFGIDKQNKNAKQILIKKAVKVVEACCL